MTAPERPNERRAHLARRAVEVHAWLAGNRAATFEERARELLTGLLHESSRQGIDLVTTFDNACLQFNAQVFLEVTEEGVAHG